jgi:hypothetical protein
MSTLNTVIAIFITAGVAALILVILSYWNIFSMAGKPGWAALIPIYNIYIMSYVVFGNINYFIAIIATWVIYLISKNFGIISLSYFVDIVSWFLYFLYNLKLSKAFGKSIGFAVGLMLLPFIFFPILGFGKTEYKGPQKLRKF